MVINGKWVTIFCNKVDYRINMCQWDFVPPQYALLIELIIDISLLETDIFLGTFKRKRFQLFQGMQSTGKKSISGEKGMVVGERIRKEPVGEAEKWKGREAVWKQLERGGISKYIEKLHGYDPKVTNKMVKYWKDRKVKVNGTYFQITEEVIAGVSEIPMEGIKFFRDKKMSLSAVDTFVKTPKERKHLIKSDTFYELNSINRMCQGGTESQKCMLLL